MKNLLKNKTFWGIFILFFIPGTFLGRLSGCLPFSNVKDGTSVGLNFSVANFMKAGSDHYGINLSLWNEMKSGSKINGINISLVNQMKPNSKINGINFGVFNIPESESEGGEVNGLELGIFNTTNVRPGKKNARTVNGIQIGLYNTSLAGPLQIGFYNAIFEKENWRESIGINF